MTCGKHSEPMSQYLLQLLPPTLISIMDEGHTDKDLSIKEESKESGKKKKSKTAKAVLWAFKLTAISFFVSALISYLTEISSNTKYISVTFTVLGILIFVSICSDCIGVAFTSCDIIPFYAMASKRVYGARVAIWLIKRNEKVASVLNDLIGDVIGVVSGACATIIVFFFTKKISNDAWKQTLPILLTATVAALTIGGKAFMKAVAINRSKEIVLAVSRFLNLFVPPKRKPKKKKS